MRMIRLLLTAGLLAVTAGGAAGTALAEGTHVYRLAPGDTVEVALGGMAGQTYRLVVQFDGSISLPNAGVVQAEGLTARELQKRLEVVLSSRPMHVRGPDGREQLVVLQPGDMTVTVADYRPIYVTGTVRSPGQQAFRPQMTVRQAMAVAGGFGAVSAIGQEAGGDLLDARSEHQSLWVEYIQELMREARIEAELAGRAGLEVALPAGAPIAAGLVDEFLRSEREALSISVAERERARAHTEETIKDLEAMIAVLTKREQDEAEAVKADEDELDRVRQVFDQGLNTNSRLGDVRRALLMSSSRLLDTTVELMRLRQQKEEEARRTEQDDNEWRVALLRELAESRALVSDLGARIRAKGGQLHPASMMPSVGADPSIVVARKVDGTWQEFPAGSDFELLPGDVVEVSIDDPATAATAVPVPVPTVPASETLHYAPNENFDEAGNFAPLAAGFNLADVSTIEQLNRLPDGVRALIWVGTCDGVTDAFQARVTPFLGNPKVFGYYLVDEPDPTGRWHPKCAAGNLRSQSDWIKTRHPEAKTFITLMSFGPAQAATYDAGYGPDQTHIDLFGINPYPCRSEFDGCDFDMIGRAVSEAVAAGYPRDKLVPTFQAFGGGNWETSGGGRYLLPTPEQFSEILARWREFLPAPVFDYTYSWGVQEGHEALETTPHLRAAILEHNEREPLGGDQNRGSLIE